VLIQCLRGALEVEAAGGTQRLGQGEAILVDPEVPHSVLAAVESDMLLTVSLERETV
jgi:quercetin dioxygenase-like cupin family protein